jgi:hypothetical protein
MRKSKSLTRRLKRRRPDRKRFRRQLRCLTAKWNVPPRE